MAEEINAKILILGSGPAGYTAAVYAARAGLEPILISGNQLGGQLTITPDIENFPAFERISGNELMEKMQNQAKINGTLFFNDVIEKVDFNSKPFVCFGESGNIYKSMAVIIATGASAKWLNIPSEDKFKGFGVSACATCDGFFYRGKEVCVIGGGNTALEEALYLTNFAKKVYVIHRRDEFRAEAILQKRVFENTKIEPVLNCVVDEILGSDNPLGVTGIRLKNVKNNQLKEINLDGVFVAIGHSPNTQILKDFINLDEENYIKTKPDSTKTNIDGIFAAGDVKDKNFRQAVIAAASGCIAALEAQKYLSGL